MEPCAVGELTKIREAGRLLGPLDNVLALSVDAESVAITTELEQPAAAVEAGVHVCLGVE